MLLYCFFCASPLSKADLFSLVCLRVVLRFWMEDTRVFCARVVTDHGMSETALTCARRTNANYTTKPSVWKVMFVVSVPQPWCTGAPRFQKTSSSNWPSQELKWSQVPTVTRLQWCGSTVTLLPTTRSSTGWTPTQTRTRACLHSTDRHKPLSTWRRCRLLQIMLEANSIITSMAPFASGDLAGGVTPQIPRLRGFSAFPTTACSVDSEKDTRNDPYTTTNTRHSLRPPTCFVYMHCDECVGECCDLYRSV